MILIPQQSCDVLPEKVAGPSRITLKADGIAINTCAHPTIIHHQLRIRTGWPTIRAYRNRLQWDQGLSDFASTQHPDV